MFDSRIQKPTDHIPILDPVTTSDYTYSNNYELPNFATQSLRNRPRNDDVGGGVQFRVQEMSHHVDVDDGVDESGISSPPLLKNSPPRSPVHQFSQNSRALAIAKGQWELMEMVKNMPESCYELSLKDLVEKNTILESDLQEDCLINKQENHHSSTASPEQQVLQQRVKKNGSKKGKMIRSDSFEEKTTVLKMLFPISLESKKNQKNVPKPISTKISPKTISSKVSPRTASTKVSPKPEITDNRTSKIVEKDWWKRRFYCSSESDSSRTGSSNSESTVRSGSSGSNDSTRNSNRKKKGLLTSCLSWSCFSKSKSAE